MNWEPILVAFITGFLGLIGVVVTVRGARQSSTRQHEEQTAHLQVLSDKVEVLADGQHALFGMVVELEKKVTKPAKKSRVSSGTVDNHVYIEP